MLRSQTIDELTLRIKGACTAVINEQEKILERLTGKLAAMDPAGVLCRGYSIVYRESDHSVVTDQSMVSEGEYVDVELSRGTFLAEIEHIGKKLNNSQDDTIT